MIIKSMPYKDPGFRKLHAYIERKAVEGCCVLRGMPFAAEAKQADAILQSFGENVRFLPTRKNGNLFYHEILSIQPKEEVSMERHLQALHDLAHHYLDQRARDHLAFGRVHAEPGNIHVHLMVSANELHSTKRHRLPKQRFSNIQKECERWLNATFPELHQEFRYNQVSRERERTSRQETERSKRTGTPSQKEELAQVIRDLFGKAEREGEFAELLESSGMELYQRRRTLGVIFEGKKYRLKTLGVLEAYQVAQGRWTTRESREQNLSEFYRKLDVRPERDFELPPHISPPVGWE